MKPILFIFSGLPGTGKTTIAKEVCKYYKATYVRIDTVEQGLRDLCNCKVEGEGYRLSYKIAYDNLLVGNNVIVDCCNPIELTRNEWNDVARKALSNHINIEIICSNKSEHKNRVEERTNDINGLVLPSWNEIENRRYEEWKDKVIRIDTAKRSISESVNDLIEELNISIRNIV